MLHLVGYQNERNQTHDKLLWQEGLVRRAPCRLALQQHRRGMMYGSVPV